MTQLTLDFDRPAAQPMLQGACWTCGVVVDGEHHPLRGYPRDRGDQKLLCRLCWNRLDLLAPCAECGRDVPIQQILHVKKARPKKGEVPYQALCPQCVPDPYADHPSMKAAASSPQWLARLTGAG